MQIKHLLVALMVLLAFTGAAMAADSVEVRSTLLALDSTGNSIVWTDGVTTIPVTIPVFALAADPGWGNPTLDYASWAGFFFDMNDNVHTEEMRIWETANGIQIVYETRPMFMNYAFDFGTIYNTTTSLQDPLGFAVIGFFAEQYVALGGRNVTPFFTASEVSAQRIARLVINDDETHLLRVGQTLELGAGYTLVAQQIDVNGNRALLEFRHEGRLIDSSIVNAGDGPGQWAYVTRVLGVNNTQVLRVGVNSVFQGTETSLVQIEGLWLVDYLNAVQVTNDDNFGEFSARVSNTSLVFTASNITLGAGENFELGKGMFIRTGDDFAETSAFMEGIFYIYKEYTTPGTIEIRSSVRDLPAAAGAFEVFNFANFAAFYFDINSDATTLPQEIIRVAYDAGNFTITYSTDVMMSSYAGWDTQFALLPLFGELFVPFNNVTDRGVFVSSNLTRIAPLVKDSDDTHLLRTGSTLELGAGYSLFVEQINVDGNQVLLRFQHNGREINSSIIRDTSVNNSTGDWILRNNLMGVNNTQVLRVHVKSVFQGTQDSLVEIEGVWLMDFANATTLNRGDDFGILELTGTGGPLVFEATDETINHDEVLHLANNMYLRTSDDDTNTRFYIFVNATVGEGTPTPEPPPIPPQPPVDPEPPTPPVDPEPPTPPVDPTPEPSEPGWFAQNWMWVVLAIFLLILVAGVAYYFLVYKKKQA